MNAILTRPLPASASPADPLAAPGPDSKGSWERLVSVVQQLSLTRDLAGIMEIVRHAARELTGADGATFVLRDGDKCFYAEEDGIAPLWKGHRFPMSICISGWVMLNRQSVVIEDIYNDSRIPAEAYRPTFVKSLAMVPIRTHAPLGAIGIYWASRRHPAASEVALLAAIADTTSVAMENVTIYQELESRVRQRTAELEFANHELEAFTSAVSHDLRSPLTALIGLSELLHEHNSAKLDAKSLDMLAGINEESRKMDQMITALLALSRVGRSQMQLETVNVTELAREITSDLARDHIEIPVEVSIQEGLTARADPSLLRILLSNLLSNAWKYSSKRPHPRIRIARQDQSPHAFFIEDNGAGFDMKDAGRLFTPFQRLHGDADFPGMGIGLVTVQRIVRRHGGRIWAQSAKDAGATFYFTLSE